MPGKKDFVSVKQEGGKRVHIQKRLVLNNLDEVYLEFKDQFPEQKVGSQNLLSCVLNSASLLELVVPILSVSAQFIRM